MVLSEEQLNNLNKEALVIIVASLQDQLSSMQSQLDTANRQLADTNRQIELLTEQIRIMNQRQFGRQSESNLIEGQLSLFDSFNEVELSADDTISDPEISEVIIASYRRKKTVGKRDTDLDGLSARVIDHRLPDEELARLFLTDTKNFRTRSIAGFTSSQKHLSWTNIMFMFTLQRIMTEPL